MYVHACSIDKLDNVHLCQSHFVQCTYSLACFLLHLRRGTFHILTETRLYTIYPVCLVCSNVKCIYSLLSLRIFLGGKQMTRELLLSGWAPIEGKNVQKMFINL